MMGILYILKMLKKKKDKPKKKNTFCLFVFPHQKFLVEFAKLSPCVLLEYMEVFFIMATLLISHLEK